MSRMASTCQASATQGTGRWLAPRPALSGREAGSSSTRAPASLVWIEGVQVSAGCFFPLKIGTKGPRSWKKVTGFLQELMVSSYLDISDDE